MVKNSADDYKDKMGHGQRASSPKASRHDFREAANQNNVVPPYRPRAKNNVPLSLEKLSEISLYEARHKEKIIRDFFKDPHGDGSERWWMAEFALDYLKLFKPEGKTRKDKHTQNILHELNPALAMMDYVRADILPKRVTYQMIDGKRVDIPKEYQSIENIFIEDWLHDTKEDYQLSTDSHFKAYMHNRVKNHPEIPAEEKASLLKRITPVKKARHSITYDYKRPTEQLNRNAAKSNRPSKVQTEPERNKQGVLTGNTIIYPHRKDHTLYGRNMENHWTAFAYKILDRIEGLVTRYGIVPDYFLVEDDQQYKEETERMYMLGQSNERMMKRYPELAEYLNVTNNLMQIAYRCFAAMTLYHPRAIENSGEQDVHAETADIDVEQWIPLATSGGVGERFIVRMLHGFELEAQRRPSLQNITKKMRKQFSRYMEVPPPPVAISKANALDNSQHLTQDLS